MSTSTYRIKMRAISLPAIVAAGLLLSCGQQKAKPAPEYKGTIPTPVQTITLADSSRIFLQKDSKIKAAPAYPQQREVNVDGDMFLEVADGTQPFIVRSRLLVLTVQGKAAFRVIAFSKEEGEEVQVISGNILVNKAYPSEFSEQDTLRNNQMVMINKTIDLMEKEKFDATDLTQWHASLQNK